MTLQPQVNGQVVEILVRPGQQVAAGQPILQIDSREQQAQVASREYASQTAEADIGSAEADVASAEETLRSLQARRETALSNVRLNQREYDRFADLLKQGATSQQNLDQRLNALETAQAALHQADAEIAAQQSAINRAKASVERTRRAYDQSRANIVEGQAQLQKYTITAPFAGTIGNIPVKAGDTVSPTTQLLTVTQNQQLEVQVQVPLERASALRSDLPVKLLDDQGKEIQTGRVSFIAPNVDPATQSVQVKAIFDNVRSGTGQMISMGNLVKVTQATGPSIINHYNLFRAIELNGAPAMGASSGQALQAMEAVAKEMLPRGFGFEWSGLSLEEIESGGAAAFIFGLAIVFVFLTLAAQYENYVDPIIIMLTVPLAILGALLAVLLRGTANDVYTQIGFVMLIGMASKNSILIVEFANEERATGKGIASAVVTAGRERLRPILMTAIATAIGSFPLLIATGPGAAARQSLGTAIVGGMIVATFLSLFIVPVLYIVIKGLEARFRRPNRALPTQDTLNGDGHSVREPATMPGSDRDGHNP